MSTPGQQNNLPEIPSITSAPAEPLAPVGAVMSLAAAVITLLVSYGVQISDSQQAAILGVVAIVGPILTVLWARRQVWSPLTVARLIVAERAKLTRPPTAP
jgi:uncharacterized YccA/Bax inhibitor family protein